MNFHEIIAYGWEKIGGTCVLNNGEVRWTGEGSPADNFLRKGDIGVIRLRNGQTVRAKLKEQNA